MLLSSAILFLYEIFVYVVQTMIPIVDRYFIFDTEITKYILRDVGLRDILFI